MPVFLIIFFFLLICYGLLIDYYRRSWNEIPDFQRNNEVPHVYISVVIPVRNEAENIQKLFQSLSNQTYPVSQYEIIIINDHSTDETWNIVQSLAKANFNIKPVQLADIVSDEKTVAYKKLAIEKGIDLAKGELIVTTDGDCLFHPDWLLYIASYYEVTKAKFIAAPVKIITDNRFLTLFQALDFLTLQAITGASIYKRFHTMCNGANLAYEKNAFLEVGGFRGINKIPSGDDMLLMYKIYEKYPHRVFYLKSNQAIVSTNPATSWKNFFHQRIRWASKATHYGDKKIFWILLLVYAINFCFLILAVASFWNIQWLMFLVLFLIMKILIELSFIKAAGIFFSERSLLKYLPLMQPLHILYTIVAGWLGKFGSYEWKGRHIKQ
jgi:cellulose synthase/poly-beta-1,6-N-acetylglucosamine synthase-like glycosyltransferase